jgi:hypothetical protein
MALLLRMAGIPARVATGFTSGALRPQDREYVVRDLDAHSWVEVWYPGYGWVTFDPTPAASPAALAAGDARSGPAAGDAPDPATFGAGDDRPRAPADRPRGRRRRVVAIAARARSRSRRWRSRCSLAVRRRAGARAAAAAELERALRRTRRDPAPGRRCTRSSCVASPRTPAAAGYVRALREQRYGAPRAARRAPSAAACGPSSGRGRRPARRLRAWWALPPEAGALGPARRPTLGGMDDVYDLYQRGTALLEDGRLPRRPRSRSPRPRPRARQDLDPRGARPRVLPLGAVRGGARGVRGGRRARADQRLRAVLPRPLADAARPPAEARKPLALAACCAPSGATTGSTATARASRLSALPVLTCYRTAFRGREATLGKRALARFFH